MRLLFLIAALVQAAFAAPQFVTFKDGKIGVNFAGYHAEAGLGGLLTGNAAHGGLSASAGTPWGPQAAAGLGGNLDGKTSGVLYAGAQSSPSQGASAVLGGTAGEHGFKGSEAHSNGHSVVRSTTYTHSGPIAQQSLEGEQVAAQAPTENAIQKIKPPKKYSLIKPEAHPAEPQRSDKTATATITPTAPPPAWAAVTITGHDVPAPPPPPSTLIVINRQRVRVRGQPASSAAEDHHEDEDDDEDNNGNGKPATAIDCRLQRRVRKCLARAHQRARAVQQQRHATTTKFIRTAATAPAPTAPAEETPAESTGSNFEYGEKKSHSKHLIKTVQRDVSSDLPPPPPPPPQGHYEHGIGVRNALQIPIGILQSLQQSFAGFGH